jgi:hypothetical protein
MQISNPAIKNISEAVVVFLFSMFIVGGSILRGYFMRGEDYDIHKLIIVPVFALILTLAYFLFKKKYLGGKCQ